MFGGIGGKINVGIHTEQLTFTILTVLQFHRVIKKSTN